MNNKRYFIGALIICLTLAGCGSAGGSGSSSLSDNSGSTSSNDGENSGKGTSSDSSSHNGGTSDSSGRDINEPWGTDGSSSEAEASGNFSSSSEGSSSSYSEVIIDTDDLYFAITGETADSVMGYTWKVSLENRTEQNLMYSMENVSINGVMCDPFWAEVVSAGKSADGQISWMQSSLEKNGTEDVTEVEFTLSVYNDDDYTESPLLHQTFTVYPQGKDKAVEVKRTDADSDKVLVENDRCRILLTSYEPENSWGYTIHLYLDNKSDEDLIFSTENASLNDKMCDPYWAAVVAAGKSANSSVTWDIETLQDSNLTADEITSISLPLLVYSEQNVAEPYVDETIELKPQS